MRVYALVILALASSMAAAQSLAGLYHNPVSNSPCADPGVLKYGGGFYLACTGGRFPIQYSSDLVHWAPTGKRIITSGPFASWAMGAQALAENSLSNQSWAPNLEFINGRFVAYYTQRNSSNLGPAIGASVSSDIENQNFVEVAGSPIVQGTLAGEGFIDPSYFDDVQSGKKYLLFKFNGNSVGKPTQILLQELTSDGLRAVRSPKVIKTGGSTFETLIEGQELVKHGGYYYLFYSYGTFTRTYRIFVARSKNVAGPYVDDRLILSEKHGGRFYAPGHGSVVEVNGKDFYFYHAYDRANALTGRVPMLDRIYWMDGWPLINDGHPSEESNYLPASEKSFYHQIHLSWNNPGFSRPMYFIDLKTPTGEEFAPCVRAQEIGDQPTFVFDGTCPSLNKTFRLSTDFKVRVCALQRGEPGSHAVCSAYRELQSSELNLPITEQKVALAWNSLGADFVYSLDARTIQDGAVVDVRPCLNAGVLGKSTATVFDGLCASQGELRVKLRAGTSLRICAAQNGQWRVAGKVSCSGYQEFSGPTLTFTLTPP